MNRNYDEANKLLDHGKFACIGCGKIRKLADINSDGIGSCCDETRRGVTVLSGERKTNHQTKQGRVA